MMTSVNTFNVSTNKLESLLIASQLFRSTDPDMSLMHMELLLHIKNDQPVDQTQLAMRNDMTLSAVCRAIDILKKGGKGREFSWVETDQTKDRRTTLISLTDEGEKRFLALISLV